MLNRYLFLLIVWAPALTLAQFGFHQDTTNSNIKVIKNGVQQKLPWVGGLDFCQYSNIDLDMDGVEDVFIFDKTCNKVITFIQEGQTGVSDLKHAPQFEKVFEAIQPKLGGWVLLADYDQDNKADIFTSTSAGVAVYRNTSTVASGLSFELSKPILTTNYEGTTDLIFASQSDIPSIIDVDNDGDLDVLSFYLGACVRYYKNLSQENYGHSDSLEFKTANVCYGNFKEAPNDNTIDLNTCCDFQVTNPELVLNERPIAMHQDRHVGSTILGLDLDADDMIDLLIGDVSYSSLTMLMNGGTTPNTNSSMISQDNNFPSYDFPVHLSIFPGAFYVDVDNDNVRDLIVSPAIASGAHNFKSNWYYKNIGADDFPDFDFQQQDFLQDEMIEFGSGALPVLFDHNSDGLLDLLVAVKAQYNLANGNTISKIAYYENTGTLNAPEFTFVTDDYQGLSMINGGANWYLYPTFGDLDNDGDQDMVLGEYVGSMMYFENTAGAGNPAAFSNFFILPDVDGEAVNEGNLSVPKLVDLDRDGLLDLVLGKLNGTLSYYRNVGTPTNFEFELQTSALGNVSVSEYWTTEGMAVPEFIDVDSEYHLVIGSKSGNLHYYDNIDGNLSGSFHLVDSVLEDIHVGEFSAPAITDIDGDDKFEMFLGNERGGLTLFESSPIEELNVPEFNIELRVYPNPADHSFTIDLSEIPMSMLEQSSYELVDISGKRTLIKGGINNHNTSIDCTNLNGGIYILNIYIQHQLVTKKIILE